PPAGADDVLAARLLLVPGAEAQGRLAPRRDRVAALVLPLAAAVRVVDGVHHGAAHGRALAQPARAAGLAAGLDLVGDVAELADGGAAPLGHAPHLAGREPQQRLPALLGDQLGGGAGGAGHLAALAGAQLDVVHRRARRHRPQRHGVARADVDGGAGLDRLADAQPDGREDVALLAVGVVQERDPGRPVGVVLDRVHLRRHAVLEPLEVDQAVAALVAAAAVAGRDAAVDVAAAGLVQRREQRPLRLRGGELLEVRHGHEPAPVGRWLELSYGHSLRLLARRPRSTVPRRS